MADYFQSNPPSLDELDWGDITKNKKNVFTMLRALGLDPSKFAKFADIAVRGGLTTEEVKARLYALPAFQKHFPGLFRKDGSMKMTAADWLKMRDSYASTARMYGVKLDKQQFGRLMTGDVSEIELKDRLEAITQVRENYTMWQQFSQFAGLPSFHNSPKAMSDFLLGLGPSKFYKAWEDAQVGFESWKAGIHLGKSEIDYISQMTPGWTQGDSFNAGEHAQKFAELANDLTTALPMSAIQGQGVTARDLLEMRFGGPNAAVTAAKVKRILATNTAMVNNKRGMVETAQADKGDAYGGGD
jgi:hypothetical protein